MDVFVLIITAIGGGSLVAIIQAVANRRAVGATAQRDLASGYGEFTDDLRAELRDTKSELREVKSLLASEQEENRAFRNYAAENLLYIASVHQLAQATGLTLPAPPAIPSQLRPVAPHVH